MIKNEMRAIYPAEVLRGDYLKPLSLSADRLQVALLRGRTYRLGESTTSRWSAVV